MTVVTATSLATHPSLVRLWAVVLVSVAAMPVTAWLAGVLGIAGDDAVLHFVRYPAWSAMMAPLMAYAWLGNYMLRPVRFVSGSREAGRFLALATALVTLAALYGLIGLAAGNPLRYVAGDTFKYLLVPFGFYLAAAGVQTLTHARWLLRAVAVFAFFPGLDVGSHVFPLAYLYGRKAVYWRRYAWLLLLPVAYWTIRANRTSLLLVPTLTLVLYYFARRVQVWRLVGAGAAIALVLWTVFQLAPGLIVGTTAFGNTRAMVANLSLVDYRLLDLSTFARVQEVVLIAQKFADASWFETVFGFGSGAMFRVSELPETYQLFYEDAYGGYAHHIHMSPVFVYHQWGLPGVALLGYACMGLLAFGAALARQRFQGEDRERQERYSVQLAGFFMALAFFLYSGWNPPKISLFYLGLVLGALWRVSDSRVDPPLVAAERGAPVPALVPHASGGS